MRLDAAKLATADAPGLNARSALYVPGDSQKKLDHAFDRGADVIIADLEDAVEPSGKADARALVGAWLSPSPPVPVWVRVNNSNELVYDILQVVRSGVSGICVPKCESSGLLVWIDGALTVAERLSGLEPSTVKVWPLIESGTGMRLVSYIAAAPRVVSLQIGEVDLASDLGMFPSEQEVEMLPFRAAVVAASNSQGLGAPLGPVSPQWKDETQYRTSTQLLARLGFGGRVCIHPRQVAIANEVFTPSAKRIEWAREVISIFSDSTRSGRGTAVGSDGRMIDAAVVRTARRVLALTHG